MELELVCAESDMPMSDMGEQFERFNKESSLNWFPLHHA
jgi:hypothetical protein